MTGQTLARIHKLALIAMLCVMQIILLKLKTLLSQPLANITSIS